MKAIWNDEIIAESDDTIIVENNHYFPAHSVNRMLIAECETQSTCPWKGLASYYDLQINGKTLNGAAWYYPNPKPAAENIANYVAFWKGVKVVD